jgi:hypothetical protein
VDQQVVMVDWRADTTVPSARSTAEAKTPWRGKRSKGCRAWQHVRARILSHLTALTSVVLQRSVKKPNDTGWRKEKGELRCTLLKPTYYIIVCNHKPSLSGHLLGLCKMVAVRVLLLVVVVATAVGAASGGGAGGGSGEAVAISPRNSVSKLSQHWQQNAPGNDDQTNDAVR